MKTTFVTIAAIASLAVFAALPTPVFAAPTCAQQHANDCPARVQCQIQGGERHFIKSVPCVCAGKCELNDFVGLAVEASRFIFGITGSLALVMFAVGGFWWLTAAGSSERIEKGKKTFVAAVIGIAIVFGAWVLVNTILATLTGGFPSDAGAVITGNWWKLKR